MYLPIRFLFIVPFLYTIRVKSLVRENIAGNNGPVIKHDRPQNETNLFTPQLCLPFCFYSPEYFDNKWCSCGFKTFIAILNFVLELFKHTSAT